jgi:alpha-amylase/alpha-mannosidase (GH57 family)
MRWEEVRYRPHMAQFGGEEIVVIVRDRELSKAQAEGMEVEWFLREVQARTRHCDFVPLVTTAGPGENGPWFRNPLPGHNFWSGFYQELLRRVQAGESAVRPVFIEEYLAQHGAQGVVNVGPGAWHGSWQCSTDSNRWAESKEQIEAFIQAIEMSQAVHAARNNAASRGCHDAEIYHQLEDAYWRVLRAETSCNFVWGEAGINRCYQDLDEASACLARANAFFSSQ